MKLRRLTLILLALASLLACAQAETGRTLQLPASLDVIEAEAFYKSTSLNRVLIPEGATRIESRAFAGSSVKEVTFPASLRFIAEDAFDNCAQFTANAPVGSYAWEWCVEHGYIDISTESPAEDFTYETLNGLYAKITKYNGTDKIVVIPEVIDDYTIQVIGVEAFFDNASVEYIVVPDTVTEFQKQAFSWCNSLKAIDMGHGVTTLGNWVFYHNPSLISIDFPDSVTTMGEGVMKDCVNLEHVGYPINWTSANSNGEVFKGCTKLTKIDIPVGVTIIPNYAFANCSELKQITLPEGLEYVYHHAFSNCTGLTEMVYPSTIKTVGGINGCTGITEVIIPEGAETIGTNAFDSVPLESIVIPNSVKEINNYAFQNCSNLNSIKFGNGLKTIGLYAFNKCIAIEKLLLPDTVESIGTYAFANCKSLSEFKYPKNWTTVTRPDDFGVSDFGHHFDNCIKLRSITIPEGATTIPRAAFAYATYLRNVTFPSTLKRIGSQAFKGCEAITELTFQAGIEEIGYGTFEDCINLIKADFPDTVSNIGCYAFANCGKLSSFHFPSSWTTVNHSTSPYDGKYYLDWGHHFDGCKELQNLTIQEGITYIPAYAFQNAIYLRKLSLPSTLKQVGFAAFEGCSGLSEINIPDSVEKMGCYCFSNCTNATKVHLPIGLKELYSATGYTHGKYMLDKGHIFDGCAKITSISIPETYISIPNYMFCGMTGLKEVNIPSTLSKINNGEFKGCTVLEKIYLGYNISTIANNAFSDCPALTIWTEYGSYALQYAKDNNIPYYYLSMNGATYPSGSIYKDDSFALYGFILSNYEVQDLNASVYSKSTNKQVYSIDLQPNSSVCNINELINSTFKFASLELGEYIYTIEASTILSKEVFIESIFTVVPPPLRLTNDEVCGPSTIIILGNSCTVSGVVRSNYIIDSISIGIYSASSEAIYLYSATPGSYTFDITSANSALLFSNLGSGNYSFKITVFANGENNTAFESSFSIHSENENNERALKLDSAFKNDSTKENNTILNRSIEAATVAYEKNHDNITEWLGSFYHFKDINKNYKVGGHSCGNTFGWKDIENANGSVTRLFVIICRGTVTGEWGSNFTVAGEGSFHYGFYTAANAVKNRFSSYLSQHMKDGENISDCKVWVTGHSRGAAVANLLGGYFLPKLGFEDSNIYCYTFACPNVTRDSLLDDKQNIFNYNLGGDLVARVPLSQWGYKVYGKTWFEPNGNYLLGINVIRESTMNNISAGLASLTDKESLDFLEKMQSYMSSSDANNVFMARILFGAVINTINPLSTSNIGALDFIETAKDIWNTHEPNTYRIWINHRTGNA